MAQRANLKLLRASNQLGQALASIEKPATLTGKRLAKLISVKVANFPVIIEGPLLLREMNVEVTKQRLQHLVSRP